jgi:tRNA-(ms[2]io[6]A)-hydroxylase
MSEKRRLPVVQPREDEGEARPAWHWSVIGAVATLLGWLPLAMLSELGKRRILSNAGDDPEAIARSIEALSPGQRMTLALLMVVGPLLSLAIAAFGAGVLVGRFGGAAGAKEATVAGAAAALLAALVVALQLINTGGLFNFALTAALVLVIAALAARGGALLGLRLRRR